MEEEELRKEEEEEQELRKVEEEELRKEFVQWLEMSE